jgi:hypothetical protein
MLSFPATSASTPTGFIITSEPGILPPAGRSPEYITSDHRVHYGSRQRSEERNCGSGDHQFLDLDCIHILVSIRTYLFVFFDISTALVVVGISGWYKSRKYHIFIKIAVIHGLSDGSPDLSMTATYVECILRPIHYLLLLGGLPGF